MGHIGTTAVILAVLIQFPSSEMKVLCYGCMSCTEFSLNILALAHLERSFTNDYSHCECFIYAENFLFCETFAQNFYLKNVLLVSPLLVHADQEEEESLAEAAKEEQGVKQGQKSSAEDAGEEQGEEKQQSPHPDQVEAVPPKEESQKNEEGEKSEARVSIMLKEWD